MEFILLIISALLLIVSVITFVLYRNYSHATSLLQIAQQRVSDLEKKKDFLIKKESKSEALLNQYYKILKNTSLLSGYLKDDEKKQVKLIKKFNEIVFNNEVVDWDMIYDAINYFHDDFCSFLKCNFPNLDEHEFKLSCLTYANFNNKEISILMGLALNTIQMKKSALRKKIGIGEYGSFQMFFDSKRL